VELAILPQRISLKREKEIFTPRDHKLTSPEKEKHRGTYKSMTIVKEQWHRPLSVRHNKSTCENIISFIPKWGFLNSV
jgi:hypothetical protein